MTRITEGLHRQRTRYLLNVAIQLCVLFPVASIAWDTVQGNLGANPIETLTNTTGIWALRLLIASLAITPIRRTFRIPLLAPHRRMLGIAAFGYGTLHFAIYVALDLGFELNAVAEDILERPYITVGFATFMCLLVLALTTPRQIARRLNRRWTKIHRLVYVAGCGAVTHYLWLEKTDWGTPLLYGSLLVLLLAERCFYAIRSRSWVAIGSQ